MGSILWNLFLVRLFLYGEIIEYLRSILWNLFHGKYFMKFISCKVVLICANTLQKQPLEVFLWEGVLKFYIKLLKKTSAMENNFSKMTDHTKNFLHLICFLSILIQNFRTPFSRTTPVAASDISYAWNIILK